jgi:hypothetical protein
LRTPFPIEQRFAAAHRAQLVHRDHMNELVAALGPLAGATPAAPPDLPDAAIP